MSEKRAVERKPTKTLEQDFLSLRRLACPCGVITEEDHREWDRLQELGITLEANQKREGPFTGLYRGIDIGKMTVEELRKALMDVGEQLADRKPMETPERVTPQLMNALAAAAQTLESLAHGDIIGDTKLAALNAAVDARRVIVRAEAALVAKE